MADTIDKAHITRFKLDYEHQVQQEVARLEGCATVDQHQGKRKRYTIQNSLSYSARTGRLQSTPSGEAQYDFRWLLTTAYHSVAQWDRDDEFLIAEMTNPNSPLQKGMMMAYKRLVDDTMITALGAAAVTGEDGTGSTAYAGGSVAVNYVPSGSAVNSNLTLEKMLETNETFLNADVDPGLEKIFVIGPSQLRALQGLTEYRSLDYNAKRGLMTGEPVPFLGFTWKVSTRLPLSSTTRTCYCYTKDTLIVNPGVREVDFSERTDQRHDRQLYSYARLGAMRLHDSKVVRVYCDEAA